LELLSQSLGCLVHEEITLQLISTRYFEVHIRLLMEILRGMGLVREACPLKWKKI